jgi:hypothetical protein
MVESSSLQMKYLPTRVISPRTKDVLMDLKLKLIDLSREAGRCADFHDDAEHKTAVNAG